MTALLATPAQVRIRPIPWVEPPRDDERPPTLRAVPSTERELPLDWGSRRSRLRPVGSSTGGAGRAGRDSGGPTGRGHRAVPGGPGLPAPSEAQIAARRFVHACVETLIGRRPLRHLEGLTTIEGYDCVEREIAPAAARKGQAPVSVRVVRVGEPVDGVAEAAAVLARGDRHWAVALRLERHHGQWLCAFLQVI